MGLHVPPWEIFNVSLDEGEVGRYTSDSKLANAVQATCRMNRAILQLRLDEGEIGATNSASRIFAGSWFQVSNQYSEK